MILQIVFILLKINLCFGSEHLSPTLIAKLETYKWHEKMCSMLGGHIATENEIVSHLSNNDRYFLKKKVSMKPLIM